MKPANSFRTSLALGLGVLACLSTPARAEEPPTSININFSVDRHASLTLVPEGKKAGLFPSVGWNNIPVRWPDPRTAEFPAGPVADSAGNATGLKLFWPDADTHPTTLALTQSQENLSPDAMLMNGHLIQTLTVADVPKEYVEKGYRIVVYSDHYQTENLPLSVELLDYHAGNPSLSQDRIWATELGGENFASSASAAFVVSDERGDEDSHSHTHGNVFVFDNVHLPAFQITVRIWIRKGTTVPGAINGIQLIPNL